MWNGAEPLAPQKPADRSLRFRIFAANAVFPGDSHPGAVGRSRRPPQTFVKTEKQLFHYEKVLGKPERSSKAINCYF